MIPRQCQKASSSSLCEERLEVIARPKPADRMRESKKIAEHLQITGDGKRLTTAGEREAFAGPSWLLHVVRGFFRDSSFSPHRSSRCKSRGTTHLHFFCALLVDPREFWWVAKASIEVVFGLIASGALGDVFFAFSLRRRTINTEVARDVYLAAFHHQIKWPETSRCFVFFLLLAHRPKTHKKLHENTSHKSHTSPCCLFYFCRSFDSPLSRFLLRFVVARGINSSNKIRREGSEIEILYRAGWLWRAKKSHEKWPHWRQKPK